MSLFKINFAVLLCLLLLSNTAHAAVLLDTTEQFFNFDFTTETQAPPYDSIEFGATFDAADTVSGSGDVFVASLYGGLDGTDLLQVRYDSALVSGLEYGPLSTANPLFDPMLDGIFSIGLKMVSGSALLQTVYASGVKFSPFSISDQIVITAGSGVPAPSTVLILLVGLFGCWFGRNKI